MKFKFVSRRNLPCPFMKIEKIALILKTKALIVSIFDGRKYLDQIKKIYYNSKSLILLILFSDN